ncbi:MAG: 16S rRNA methyltransferase [Phycisphaerae bacterium]|nr:16S rRNA methyltransferase [Phycisphaerae bacterium]
MQSLSSHRTDEAIELASSLGIKHVSQSDDPIPEGELRIVLLDDRMELWDQFSRRRGMRVGFQSIDRRVGNGSLSHKQPLARAIGKSARTIVDATAGLGHDSFLMACMGWHVKAIERHPVIGVLLKESVRDAITHPDLSLAIEDRLVVHQGDAVEILGDMDAPDVIYLDPMFQDVHGSALPRKPAQILRKVVPLDGIEEQIGLFEVSRNLARQRVVVKRSDKSPPLVDGSDISYHGKIVRYDVYLTGT